MSVTREKLHEESEFKNKLSSYRAMILIRSVTMEGVSVISVISYFVSDNSLFLVFAVVWMVLFAMMRPQKDKIIKSLSLDPNEEMLLQNPDAVVAEYQVQ